MIKLWFKSGAPWVWLNAAAVSTCLIMVIAVLGLITVRGVGHFWPSKVLQFSYQEEGSEQQNIIGELVDSSITPAAMAKAAGYKLLDNEDSLTQYLIKTGNRDVTGNDFRWIQTRYIKNQDSPADLVVLERREWGNFYGRLIALKENGNLISSSDNVWTLTQQKLIANLAIFDEIKQIEKKNIGAINYNLERLRLKQKSLQLKNSWNSENEQQLNIEKADLDTQYKQFQTTLIDLYQKVKSDSIVVKADNDQEIEISLSKIVKIFRPNQMGLFDKISHYSYKLVEFLTDEPREANTEGGIFPAIFGTVMMVMMMSVIVTPFGVIAAVYLREYAKQGFITRLIRIAVNNLAGVPSIVYGVFGLGFFVYILGGNIDRLFFPEAAPAPVYGTPGLLWASITLALLTLPVVIVSTEEGLSRIPKSIREGSLALGATKFETLWLTVLPMASPAMMTGLILAVARAAGEVAPLMLVGVVKMAPTLPLDGNFPFLHLDRKFMHLGFHIYDVGFQSPNVEAARPLVYATSLLLVVVILGLNMAAIVIRNHLREKYRALEG